MNYESSNVQILNVHSLCFDSVINNLVKSSKKKKIKIFTSPGPQQKWKGILKYFFFQS